MTMEAALLRSVEPPEEEHVVSERRPELVERARQIAPKLAVRAAADPWARRVSAEAIAEIRAAELLTIGQPLANGGQELDWITCLEVMSELAKGCPSTAWLACVGNGHAWLVGHWPDACQEELYSDRPDAYVAGVLTDRGTAVPTDGGWRLSGFWPFGSGIDHADWAILGGHIDGPDGRSEDPSATGMFVVRADELSFRDDWHASGLRATGSSSVIVDDVFVPEHRFVPGTVLASGSTPGMDRNRGWAQRSALMPTLAFALTPVAVGAARAALTTFTDEIQHKVVSHVDVRQTDWALTHRQFAQADSLVDQGELLLRRTADQINSMAQDGVEMDLPRRARVRLDCAYGVRRCLEAVEILYLATGGQGVRDTNRIGRLQSDLQAINMHAITALDPALEAYGRVLMGHPPRTPRI